MTTTPFRRLHAFSASLMVAAVLLSAPTVHAAPAKPNPTAAKNSRTSAETAKKLADAATAKYSQAAPEIKKAAEGVATAYQAVATAQNKLADAWDVGLMTDVSAALTEVTKASAAVSRANELLTTLEREADYNSTTNVEAWKKSTAEAALPQLDSYLTARKAAASAAAKLAAALSAESTPEALDSARDEWFTADAEVKLASRVWNYTSNLASRAAAATKTNNTDLNTKVDELKALDNKLFNLLKQQNDLALELRKLERQRLKEIAAAAELAKPKKK